MSRLSRIAAAMTAPNALHHIEIWVPDWDRGAAELGWMLEALDYVQTVWWPRGGVWDHGPWPKNSPSCYIVIEQSPDLKNERYDRLRPGLNHLAFCSGTRQRTDELAAESLSHGWTLMFADRDPFAGGPHRYAKYLESSDGFEIELVASMEGTQQ